MKVSIKQFNVDMDVKNKGGEFGAADTSGKHLGDLVLTKTKVIGCRGRTAHENGHSLSWEKFMELMEQQ